MQSPHQHVENSYDSNFARDNCAPWRTGDQFSEMPRYVLNDNVCRHGNFTPNCTDCDARTLQDLFRLPADKALLCFRILPRSTREPLHADGYFCNTCLGWREMPISGLYYLRAFLLLNSAYDNNRLLIRHYWFFPRQCWQPAPWWARRCKKQRSTTKLDNQMRDGNRQQG